MEDKIMIITDRLLAEASKQAYKKVPRVCDTYAIPFTLRNHQVTIYRTTDYAHRIIIAFAGTNDIKDFVYDFAAWKKRTADGRIHSGFLKAFYELNDVYAKYMQSYFSDWPIWVTGHSLGGALAMIFAYYYRKVLPIQRVVTFGSPRVGDRRWKKNYNEQTTFPTIRYVNDQDIVARLPTINYFHTGKSYYFDNQGLHVDKQPRSWKILWRRIEGIGDHDMDKYLELMGKHGL